MPLGVNYIIPGNVRELENIIERGVALTNGGVIETGHLPEDLRELSIKTFRKKEGKIPSLEEQEEAYIKWVLNEAGGNKTLAAQLLGIDEYRFGESSKNMDWKRNEAGIIPLIGSSLTAPSASCSPAAVSPISAPCRWYRASAPS